MESNDDRLIVFAGREDVNREYKASFPWCRKTNGPTLAKVVKTILAMSNLRDGGNIVIGVEEQDGKFKETGVDLDHIATFAHDNIADFVREYAEPYARIEVQTRDYPEGHFVLIRVEGFHEVPVICRKSYDNILVEGSVYVRSLTGRPSSVRISRYVDMQELLDLAVERGVRRYLQKQARLSAEVSQASILSDRELFERQLGDLA